MFASNINRMEQHENFSFAHGTRRMLSYLKRLLIVSPSILFLLSTSGECQTRSRYLRRRCAINSTTADRCSGPIRSFKNVIILIPDGCDGAIQTLARWYKNETLQVDQMAASTITNHMANSVMTGSGAAATAFACGIKTTERFLGIGPRRSDLLSIYDPSEMAPPYAPVASILEAARLAGKSKGIVATFSVTHATPAAFACHIDDRRKHNDIMEHIVFNSIDVVFGGGKRHLLPGPDCPNAVAGGQRTDCQNLKDVLINRDYQFVESKDKFERLESGKVWGLFALDSMRPEIDRARSFSDLEPSLSEMTEKAIDLLSDDTDGFVLVVEGSQIDTGGHSNDPIFMLTEFIEFDNAVKIAVDFAKDDGKTLVLVYPDHATGGFTIGNYLHGYADVSVEDLVGPLQGMTTTASGVVRSMPDNPSDNDIIDSIRDKWGIEVTGEDVQAIRKYMDDTRKPLNFALARIVSERYTYLGWSTHGHNGDMVPLWIYGGIAPSYVIDNTELALMAANAIDVDLNETTNKLFVDLGSQGIEYEVTTADSIPVATAGGAVFPLGRDYMFVDGERIQLPGISVFAPMTGQVFVARSALDHVLSGGRTSELTQGATPELASPESSSTASPMSSTISIEAVAVFVAFAWSAW